MAPPLHDVAVAHHENHIRVLNGGEPVRDDEAGLPSMSRAMAFESPSPCGCPRWRWPRPVPGMAGSVSMARAMVRSCICPWETPAVAREDEGVVPLGQCADKVVAAGGPGARRNLLPGGVHLP